MARNVWLMEADGGQTKSKPATFGEFQLLQNKQLQAKKQPQKSNPIPPLPAQVKARHAQTTQPTSAPRVSGIVPQTTHSVVQPVKTAPTPTTTVTTATPTEPERTTDDMIREMIEAQRKARIAELDKARDAALANLESEQSRLQPAYYDARNQAAAQSDLGALNFAQYMASRGVKGGAAGMPEIYRNAALQGEIGALNRQEQMALDAIERDRTGVLSAYEQDRVAALADLDARALQAQIEQMNTDRQFGLQEASVTGEYQGSPTLQKMMWQSEVEYRNKQLAIDAAYKQGQLSLQRAQQAMAAAKFEYQKQQDALNRQYQAEKDAYARQQDQLARMDSLGLTERAIGPNVAYVPKSTPSQPVDLSGYMEKAISLSGTTSPSNVMAYIRSLPISSQEKANMANSLGLQK
jgi:hypothetical protein